MAQPLRSVPRPHPQLGRASTPLATLVELFDAALDAVVVTDRDGVVGAWNQRAQEIFGWSAREAIGRRLSELIIPEPMRRDHERGLLRVRSGRRPRMLNRRRRMTALHRDGHELPVELAVTTIGPEHDRSYAGFIRDLTRETETEAARHEAELRYRSLIERLPGIAYVDEIGGETRFVGPRLEAILGYCAEEWSFELWRSRVHSRDRAAVLAALAAGEASDEPFSMTYRIRARDGHWVWIRDEAMTVTERDGGRAVHGVMFDISQERRTELALRDTRRERRMVAESLHRLSATDDPEQTAAAICEEIARIRHMDMAVVYSFEGEGSVVPLALTVPPGAPVAVGLPLPADRAAYLRASATGPWIDEWAPSPNDDEYRSRWLETGLTCAVYVPFGAGGVTYGLLAAGTTTRLGVEGVSAWLPALTEYAAIASALLTPAMTNRRARADVAGPIRSAIESRAFTPHFQAIVELESRTVIGYEALTRFHDGTPPERRFADADAVGLGRDLELACVAAALESARRLPDGRWLSLNLSPHLITALATVPGLAAATHSIVLELTERLEVSDYDAVRRAIAALPVPVDIAVDDAGAGFASLRHIIELRPRCVKLDQRLVRGVETDPARQAMIAGMVYFSRQTDCILVAEGIETEAERRVLRQLGVSFGQGYLFGAPAPVETFAQRP